MSLFHLHTLVLFPLLPFSAAIIILFFTCLSLPTLPSPPHSFFPSSSILFSPSPFCTSPLRQCFFSVPHPSCLLSALYKENVSSQQFVLPMAVSLTLVPSGVGVSDMTAFGQCLCVEWLPCDGHTQIAAGFSNG